jgi:hypothetical protein
MYQLTLLCSILSSGQVKMRLRELGASYANIILAESNYQQWRQEQIFYEAFYELTFFVVNTYTEMKFEERVDEEIGRIFRTPAFNFSKKNDSSGKSVLSARELYSLRYEGDSYSNNRILATLHPRHRDQSVHRYLKAHSPIIATVLPETDDKDEAEAALDTVEGGMGTIMSLNTQDELGGSVTTMQPPDLSPGDLEPAVENEQ